MKMGKSDNRLYVNGVNGETGGYLLPPLELDQVVAVARGEQLEWGHFVELQSKYAQVQRRRVGVLGVAEGIDPLKLDETGWGVIFASGDTQAPDIQEALSPLLALRKAQAGQYYYEYSGTNGYTSGESKMAFLERHGVGPGPADPKNGMPYYVLIVGSPEIIPYRFQYQLDVQYAVGRIYFDTLDEYASYARSVVAAERGEVVLPRQATFFSVANPGDEATALSTENLVKPLVHKLIREQQDQEHEWTIQSVVGEQATKARFRRLLGGDATRSALLFAAGHGVGFPMGHSKQEGQQGALLCQDWPGVEEWGRRAFPPEFYFAAHDVEESTRLNGLIAFFFACFGAGTPKVDNFYREAYKARAETIAQHPFIARLPQRMLAHANGGALAVVGHIDRAWSYSFMWGHAEEQVEIFESTLMRLMRGYPVGSAIEYFNERYAEIAVDLSNELEEVEFGRKVRSVELARLWTMNNDARNYVILGDPAVRLPLGGGVGDDVALSSSPLTLDVAPAWGLSDSSPPSPPVDGGESDGSVDGGESDASSSAYGEVSMEGETAIGLREQHIQEVPKTMHDVAAGMLSELAHFSVRMGRFLSSLSIARVPSSPEISMHALLGRLQKARAVEDQARAQTDACMRELEAALCDWGEEGERQL